MADTTLISALSAIADAIREKGIDGTMNAWEMPTRIEEIQTEKYGIPIGGILGDVDANGELQRDGEPFSFSSSEITSIPAYYFDRAFYRKNIQSIDLPNLTTIGTETFISSASQTGISSVSMPELSAIPNFGLEYAFRHCSALQSVDLDSVETVGESGLQGCCFDDPALVSFKASSISSVGQDGMYRCLSGCTSLEEVCLSSLTSAGNRGLDECFMGCTSLKKVQMPLSSAGTNALRNTFNGCSALEEVDFSEATSVPALSNVNCFANTNETYRIVVPDALYDQWIAAGNWSSLSSHMVKASEYA